MKNKSKSSKITEIEWFNDGKPFKVSLKSFVDNFSKWVSYKLIIVVFSM